MRYNDCITFNTQISLFQMYEIHKCYMLQGRVNTLVFNYTNDITFMAWMTSKTKMLLSKRREKNKMNEILWLKQISLFSIVNWLQINFMSFVLE